MRCRANLVKLQLKCSQNLNGHLERILSKKGRVKKRDNTKIGMCYYKSLQSFSRCVRKAPEVPEGMEYQGQDEKEGTGVLKEVVGHLGDLIKKKIKQRVENLKKARKERREKRQQKKREEEEAAKRREEDEDGDKEEEYEIDPLEDQRGFFDDEEDGSD